MEKRPYWGIPIQDQGEPLVAIPLQDFAHSSHHDYQVLGAPYGNVSPYYLRDAVLTGLYLAQEYLQKQYPHWQIYIFDAYRPLAVQAFMANHAFQALVTSRGFSLNALTDKQQALLWSEVYQIWAPPNQNPRTPPPHSTGGAVDITLYDQEAQSCVWMGSPIDEISERSHPHYFDRALKAHPGALKNLEQARLAAKNRQVLADIMTAANFCRHPGEWWHFCLGDQMWVWLAQQHQKSSITSAWYGRYDLLQTTE